MTGQLLLTWLFHPVPRDNLILPALLLKNPYCKYLLKGISVGGSCCASACVLIKVVQSRQRNILNLVCVSFNWRGEKNVAWLGPWGNGEFLQMILWKISAVLKRERRAVNEAAKRWRNSWKTASQESVGTVRAFSRLDLIQTNQKQRETFLLTAMILLLADPF